MLKKILTAPKGPKNVAFKFNSHGYNTANISSKEVYNSVDGKGPKFSIKWENI